LHGSNSLRIKDVAVCTRAHEEKFGGLPWQTSNSYRDRMVTTWRLRARGLAGAVAAEGVLRSAAWREALEATPRHAFVPRFFVQRPDGTWAETTSADDGWLAAVYRNEPLVTDPATLASAAKPGLLVRMLEALDVRDGHRVLEIGTGPGYLAALLAHRLGPDRVFSAETPHDVQQHAPFDRIIATCTLPAVPRAWAELVCEGGLVLACLEPGGLVLLTRHADRLEGAVPAPRGLN
jgi:protein-L-isoaspartate O-methyltransferase